MRLTPALLILLVVAPGASAFLAPLLKPMGAMRASRPICLLPARIGCGEIARGAGGRAGVGKLERWGGAGRAGLVPVRGQQDSKADAGERRTDWNGERRREEAREKEKLEENRERNPGEELEPDSGAPLPPHPGYFSTPHFQAVGDQTLTMISLNRERPPEPQWAESSTHKFE